MSWAWPAGLLAAALAVLGLIWRFGGRPGASLARKTAGEIAEAAEAEARAKAAADKALRDAHDRVEAADKKAAAEVSNARTGGLADVLRRFGAGRNK